MNVRTTVKHNFTTNAVGKVKHFTPFLCREDHTDSSILRSFHSVLHATTGK